ncbi:hypothetical protein MCEL_26090 [Mycolicibacterium celeriflavum]|uniref:Uncharacterized protein n=1 Tax=Mycolicibacterium celeriflavum TaxID=1249101 RepID=A0A7I7RIA7_MYCCF|nr:hypothetical protein MCEL_26090 [Mycolicibacterium celeriflavum]
MAVRSAAPAVALVAAVRPAVPVAAEEAVVRAAAVVEAAVGLAARTGRQHIPGWQAG